VVTRRIAERLREKGVEMLDAPVSGGEEGAINATLSIMVGGRKEVFEKHKDIFETLGRNVVHVGDNGAGQIAKACNQIIVAGTLEIVSEALMLASMAGVDPERVVKAITGGAADCWALRARAPKMLKHDFKPGFKSSYHFKDLKIAVSTASEYGAVLPVTQMLHEMFKSMVQKKRGDYDHSGIATIIEDLSNHKIS
ncbi:MAG: NAD-binding protein, partial [Archaeoglobi archaeon]|nr:NAD-binding protein [Candidatus Mnemosynella sp.]